MRQMRPESNVSTPSTISDEFLITLVGELDEDSVTAIILGGSQARGDATPYSDVDVMRFVKEHPGQTQKRYTYRNGHLISIGTRTISMYREWLKEPERAIFVVPSMREARILLDKHGEFRAFQQEVMAFTWEPLQETANYRASDILMLLTEFVHKILSALLLRDELSLSQSTIHLFSDVTDAVAIQRGILVKSGNTYYRQIQEAIGLDSSWTHYHRLVAGVDALPSERPLVEARAIAVLHLYKETVELLQSILYPTYREVIEQSVQVLEGALPRY